MGTGWGKPAAIWSVGCTVRFSMVLYHSHNSSIQVYELAMGRSFFDRNIMGESVPYLHAIVFGDYPAEMIARGKFRDVFFNQDGG